MYNLHRPDDFKVGKWLAIAECYESFTHPMTGNEIFVGSELKGYPMKIKAINLPYVAVEFNYPTGTKVDFIDIRKYGFVKLNNNYVKQLKCKPVKKVEVVSTNESGPNKEFVPVSG